MQVLVYLAPKHDGCGQRSEEQCDHNPQQRCASSHRPHARAVLQVWHVYGCVVDKRGRGRSSENEAGSGAGDRQQRALQQEKAQDVGTRGTQGAA